MPKKYVQLLLSIHFCLTATTAIANTDVDSDTISTSTEARENQEEDYNTKLLRSHFNQIWDCLDQMATLYHFQPLKEFIKQRKDIETPYEESVEEVKQEDLTKERNHFRQSLTSYLKDQKHPYVETNAALQKLRKQLSKALTRISFYTLHRDFSSKEKKAFSMNQFKKFQGIPILTEDIIETATLQNDHDVTIDSEVDPHALGSEVDQDNDLSALDLANKLNQFWDYLETIYKISPSSPLQELLSHRNAETDHASLEEIDEEDLENQFQQLRNTLKTCSGYQQQGSILDMQLDELQNCLLAIHDFYKSKKETLSKKKKFHVSNQLKSFQKFFADFPTCAILTSLDQIQMLLDSCKEEDSLIYSQYEYIMNSQEADISNLLSKNTIENQLLHFNKAEGLMEIKHTESSEGVDSIEPYTTTWKVRPADIESVNNWREGDPIKIENTGILYKYTMRGEKLDYTLTNNKKSVRVNFVCKSSNENTYTILSIDYLENMVVLKNGPCLFVQSGDLKEWHSQDIVVLQRLGPATDKNASHKLINTTRRHDQIRVSLKKR
ncbi:MAG: hypothetical protein LBC45_03685 [Chlamydiales bacterium]|jgi:hypothetical protein|nr:hypothetical protein [Chlamydiales bacterium]